MFSTYQNYYSEFSMQRSNSFTMVKNIQLLFVNKRRFCKIDGTSKGCSFILALSLLISWITVSNDSRPSLEVGNPFSAFVHMILVRVHCIITSISRENYGSQCKGYVHIAIKRYASKSPAIWPPSCHFQLINQLHCFYLFYNNSFIYIMFSYNYLPTNSIY
ncbi:hypothetical protein V8G54_032475 [Vigna mungo]|uniref:Uncharacterized protein n=1 Tax=Vigna mungo TaxID=3915 RepID=A0AAQ3RHX7_VIGMU